MEHSKNLIYPEILFYKLVKYFERRAMSWPVNLKTVISGRNASIKDGILRPNIF